MPVVVATFSGKGTGVVFSGERQAGDVSLRFGQGAARRFELARECVQVHTREWNRVAARGTVHVGTPRLGEVCHRERASPSAAVDTERGEGERGGHGPGNSSGISCGSVR